MSSNGSWNERCRGTVNRISGFRLCKDLRHKKNAKDFEGDRIFKEIDALDNDPITVLIKNLTNRKWIKAFELSSESRQDEYSDSVGEILNSVISTHQKIWELADIYCESAGGSAEERFDFFHAVSEPFTSKLTWFKIFLVTISHK